MAKVCQGGDSANLTVIINVNKINTNVRYMHMKKNIKET